MRRRTTDSRLRETGTGVMGGWDGVTGRRECLDQTCSGFNRRSGSTCSVAACPTSRKCELRNDDLLLAILLWCLFSYIAAKRGSYSPSSGYLTIKKDFLQPGPAAHRRTGAMRGHASISPQAGWPARLADNERPGTATSCLFATSRSLHPLSGSPLDPPFHARHPHHRY